MNRDEKRERWHRGDYLQLGPMEYNPNRMDKLRKVLEFVGIELPLGCTIEQMPQGEHIVKDNQILDSINALLGEHAHKIIQEDLLDHLAKYLDQKVEVMKGFETVEMPLWKAKKEGFNL